jgi:hypothetical protein
MTNPSQAQMQIWSVEAMIAEAQEMINKSDHDVTISRAMYLGQKGALLRVVRMLENTNKAEHKEPVVESFAKFKGV